MSDDNETIALRGNWNYPTHIRFGAGRIVELAEACRELTIKRPLLVTDKGLAATEMVTTAQENCRKEGLDIGLFDDIKPNPTGENVLTGVDAFNAGQHDGVIAFGGGSSLDAGKAIALMVGQTRLIWDFEDVGDNWTRVKPDTMAPVIAVPTTAGTGSEVGRASVIVDTASQQKKIIFHPKMLPPIVIADPELTVGLSPALTAATGMDAFAHCLEAYCAQGYHPMADGIAVEGMCLVKTWLPVAVIRGTDIRARSHMLAAAMMGATAFQKGLGGVHALAHPLGARYDVHHGLLNAILMPYVLNANRSAIAPSMGRLARVLDLAPPSIDAVMDWLVGLRADIGIPHTLEAIGIGYERIDDIAELAVKDPSSAGNPLPLNAPDYKTILAAAIRGEL